MGKMASEREAKRVVLKDLFFFSFVSVLFFWRLEDRISHIQEIEEKEIK